MSRERGGAYFIKGDSESLLRGYLNRDMKK